MAARLRRRCSLILRCAPESAPCDPAQTQWPLCELSPWHRHPLRRTPGAGFPPSPAKPTEPSDGPIELHITAHCVPSRGGPVTEPAIPDLALVGARPTWQAPRPSRRATGTPSAKAGARSTQRSRGPCPLVSLHSTRGACERREYRLPPVSEVSGTRTEREAAVARSGSRPAAIAERSDGSCKPRSQAHHAKDSLCAAPGGERRRSRSGPPDRSSSVCRRQAKPAPPGFG